jgi:hypothetical protein
VGYGGARGLRVCLGPSSLHSHSPHFASCAWVFISLRALRAIASFRIHGPQPRAMLHATCDMLPTPASILLCTVPSQRHPYSASIAVQLCIVIVHAYRYELTRLVGYDRCHTPKPTSSSSVSRSFLRHRLRMSVQRYVTSFRYVSIFRPLRIHAWRCCLVGQEGVYTCTLISYATRPTYPLPLLPTALRHLQPETTLPRPNSLGHPTPVISLRPLSSTTY